jgi:hypothetical protein
MRRARLLALTALVTAALSGCNSSPSEPSQIIPLTGTLTKAGTIVTTVSLKDTGNMRIRAIELQPLAADGTPVGGSSGIIINVGDGNENVCVAAGGFSFVQGSVISLGLQKGSYCLKLTEPGLVADDGSLRYNISLEITE